MLDIVSTLQSYRLFLATVIDKIDLVLRFHDKMSISHHCDVQPPSIDKFAPVIALAASLHR
jgi:hypothetical protein